MKVRRLFVLMGTALVLTLGLASAAYAVDYPPTTSVQDLGSTVTSSTVAAAANSNNASGATGLPFTGGNSAELVWVAVALLASGTFAAWRFGRRARAS
ncbi:MAG TPA: hypothetical protein VGP92_08245 [Acidimicrobiia bacterium]|jgi:hypothetical protein|nr:hypothetical protein [Acidimicrobiia bacterium]